MRKPTQRNRRAEDWEPVIVIGPRLLRPRVRFVVRWARPCDGPGRVGGKLGEGNEYDARCQLHHAVECAATQSRMGFLMRQQRPAPQRRTASSGKNDEVGSSASGPIKGPQIWSSRLSCRASASKCTSRRPTWEGFNRNWERNVPETRGEVRSPSLPCMLALTEKKMDTHAYE